MTFITCRGSRQEQAGRGSRQEQHRQPIVIPSFTSQIAVREQLQRRLGLHLPAG
jgi:hypothetical protein